MYTYTTKTGHYHHEISSTVKSIFQEILINRPISAMPGAVYHQSIELYHPNGIKSTLFISKKKSPETKIDLYSVKSGSYTSETPNKCFFCNKEKQLFFSSFFFIKQKICHCWKCLLFFFFKHNLALRSMNTNRVVIKKKKLKANNISQQQHTKKISFINTTIS